MHHEQTRRALTEMEAFLTIPLDTLLARHAGLPAAEAALALFRSVAATVPAYRSFLAERGVDPAAVRTPDDFRLLPLLTTSSGRSPTSGRS
jgi:phenylacetate-CoA ligase